MCLESNVSQDLAAHTPTTVSLLQETHDQMNDSSTKMRKVEKNEAAIEGDPKGESMEETKQEQVKPKGLKQILTSSILLEDHKKDDKTMFNYHQTQNQEHGDLSNQSIRVRKRKSHTASIATTDLDNHTSNNGSTGGAQRRLWVKNRSKDWWETCNSPDFPDHEFKKAFRMGKDTFNLICNELTSVIAKENTMLRDAVPVKQRVAVCLWRLATGEPLRMVSRRFGLGISTCHKLVLEVCSAIKDVLMPKYLKWPDNASLRTKTNEFKSFSGIPNVVGTIYTTHIPIIAPKVSISAYYNKQHTDRNHKTSYTITVQGVLDPHGVFTDVCIGWPGSMSNDQILEKSALFQRANGGLLNDLYVVGGSGYPLTDWLLVPYTHPHLTWTQHGFNEKVLEVEKIAKDGFSRLKGRWGCLQKRTEMKLQDLPVVLGACCVLHNICEMRNEEIVPELMIEVVDDEMVPEIGLRSVGAMKVRDSLAHNLLHCNHAGTSFLS